MVLRENGGARFEGRPSVGVEVMVGRLIPKDDPDVVGGGRRGGGDDC